MTSPTKQMITDSQGFLVLLAADGSIRRQRVVDGISTYRLEWAELDTSGLDSRVTQIACDHRSRLIVLCLDGKLHEEKPQAIGTFRLVGDDWQDVLGPFDDPAPEPARHA